MKDAKMWLILVLCLCCAMLQFQVNSLRHLLSQEREQRLSNVTALAEASQKNSEAIGDISEASISNSRSITELASHLPRPHLTKAQSPCISKDGFGWLVCSGQETPAITSLFDRGNGCAVGQEKNSPMDVIKAGAKEAYLEVNDCSWHAGKNPREH